MKLSKKQTEEYIREFFNNIDNKNSEQIRKIKRLAMHHKIRLGELKKKFCKFCFSNKLKTLRIKNKIKTLRCENCGKIFRFKIS